MTGSQRILLNTLATYGRSVFGMALGLFSARWVLQSLGQVDYGLMSVVGGLIVFVTLINSILAGSVMRFYAYAIGRNDAAEITRWFNIAVLIHTTVPLLLVLIGWPIGEWAITSFLNIPAGRQMTALWIFRGSIVSAYLNMAFVPYIAMFTAMQSIYEISFWGMLQTSLNFMLAYCLTRYSGDAWLLYGIGMVTISISIGMILVLRAHHLFQTCRINFHYWLDRKRIVDVFSFSAWKLFGAVGGVLREQGIAILLNKYFPPAKFPAVNASFTIGTQVSAQSSSLSNALLGAFTPAIVSAEGSGNRSLMLLQANRSSKFGTFLVFLFTIPLFIETDYVLKLWLKTPPELAVAFCRIMFVLFWLDRLSSGTMASVGAVGKIAWYQATVGGLLLATMPIVWFLFSIGAGPLSLGYAFILLGVLMTIGRIIWAKYLTGASILCWIREVLTPCLLVLVISATAGVVVSIVLSGVPPFIRLLSVCGVCTILWAWCGWKVVVDPHERMFLLSQVKAVGRRLGFLGGGGGSAK